jgi:hypothetical protein
VSRRAAKRLAWSLFGVSAVAGFTGLGLKASVENVATWDFVVNDGIGIAIFFVSGVVGALIASRFPANPIGWIFVGLVVALGFSGGAEGVADWSLAHGRSGGVVPWVAAYNADVFLVFFAVVLSTLLLFPNGRLLTPRWRFVLWTGLAGNGLMALSAVLSDGPLSDFPELQNPVGVDSAVLHWSFVPGFVFFCAALIATVVSVVLRFRRAVGVERRQLTLLLAAGVFVAAAFVVGGFVGSALGENFGVAVTLLAVLAIPVAIGVAMLRYRLYEIDRVVSRTLVYAALTVILGAAYAGLVLAGQAVFSSFAGGSNLAIAVSTLVVAALFLPLRSRVQRVVDRRFYRRRYDAERTLERFGTRLREQVELDRLRAELEDVVRDTVQPAHVSLWLRKGTGPA